MTNTNDPDEHAGEPSPAARTPRLQALLNATRNRLLHRPVRRGVEQAVGEAVDEAMRVDPQDLPLFQDQLRQLQHEARERPQDQTPAAASAQARIEINDSGETAEEFLARIAQMGPELWNAVGDDELSAMNEAGWQVCIEHVEGVTAQTKLAFAQTKLSLALMKAPCRSSRCAVPGCTAHVIRRDRSPEPSPWLVQQLEVAAAQLDPSLIARLAAHLDYAQCPESAFTLDELELRVASDVMSLPLWTHSPGLGGPSPAQLKKIAQVMDVPMFAELEVAACPSCTLTDTPADDTHWLIEVACIYTSSDLGPEQAAVFTQAAATCGADFYEPTPGGGTNGVMYVGGAIRDAVCPPQCTAHTDHTSDCRPRPGRADAPGEQRPLNVMHDRVEDAVRAEVARQLGPSGAHHDELGGRSLKDFPEELLQTLRPILDPAGMHRDRQDRRWFTVTLPMPTAARIIVNWHWAPELDLFDRNLDDDDLSGYYVVPSPMAAHWLLGLTHFTDQHWTMRLRFTDLSGQERPAGVDPYAESTSNPAKTTGAWTVSIDWLRVDMDPRPDIATPVLIHQARDQMLDALNWTSFSQDHPEMAPHKLWRDCGLIDFRDSPYSTGPKPGDVCSCGAMTGTDGTLIAPPAAPNAS